MFALKSDLKYITVINTPVTITVRNLKTEIGEK